MALNLYHQTLDQFINRLRIEFLKSNGDFTARLARVVVNRIQAGDITDLQLRTAFGLNNTQWNTLKTKMSNLVASFNAVEGARGE